MITSSPFETMKAFLAAATRFGSHSRFVPVVATFAFLVAGAARANGFGENGAWQFQTQQDRVHKGAVLDMVERKKAGFYDAMKPVYNYTTHIERQYNCNLTASTSGNSGTNSTSASTSSPTVTNSGTTSSAANANSATNGADLSGLGLSTAAGTTATPDGTVQNSQSNTGQLQSGVSGSSNSALTGEVSSSGGRSDQVLNSQQTSSGTLTASISGSTACSGALNGY